MLLCLLLAVGPLQQGPWVYGARENSVNILWVSEKPGDLPSGIPILFGRGNHEGKLVFER